MKIKILNRHEGIDQAAGMELRRRARAILAPYAGRLQEVSLRLSDPNGLRRGEDLLCVATARLGRNATVTASARSRPNVDEASTALRRLRRSLRKQLERRRTLRRRRGG